MLQEAVDPNANVIMGALVDESLTGQIAITVIATGFPNDSMRGSSSSQRAILPTATSAAAVSTSTKVIGGGTISNVSGSGGVLGSILSGKKGTSNGGTAGADKVSM